MAVPFSNTKLRVPRGFQNILEGLAREVLRSQPNDIYAFGAVYFEQLLKLRDGKYNIKMMLFCYVLFLCCLLMKTFRLNHQSNYKNNPDAQIDTQIHIELYLLYFLVKKLVPPK